MDPWIPIALSKSRIVRVSRKQEDSGVAEIVGAILLFAVLISLFTSFIAWYVPVQTTNNEVHYEQQTKSSMGSLISQIHNGVPDSASTLSQSIDLGISGVSIFSSSQDTEFSVLPGSTSFNASMAVQLVLNVTSPSGGLSNLYVNESYTASGIMASNGNTEYVTPINYVIEDGALFQNYGGSQPSNTLGPMPVGIVNNSGQYGLSVSVYGIGGQSVTYSASQSEIVNLYVNTSLYNSYVNGSSASLSGSLYTINRITLSNLNYTLNGTLLNAWNFGLFSKFNNTNPGYSNVVGLSVWNFSGLPFRAYLYGNQLSLVNSRVVNLSSFSSEYLVITG